LLGQMLDNLLDNAFKYSEPVTPVTLRVAPGAGANMTAITVEDAGPGIPAADLPHIFEPFYCSPDARRRGRAGCGLGLSVAHRIATAFGGSLHAQSTPAEGSRFTILLRRHDHDREQDRLAPLALQTNTRR
jgi:signal transduction histidine kinase